ncbi:MAG: HAMP domain-containing histidine kinase [Oscillospiraceae bacterium]|nr:HAMP domain-containing histidine kinase [Oscillospiraceae bacterium]
MDKEIKRLRNKFFLLSSVISFMVIFVMMVVLNVLMQLSYKNEQKAASDMLIQTAFSKAADTTSELIYIKDMEINELGNRVINRDPTTIKKVTLNGTMTCADKTAEWYSAGGGIFFEYTDESSGKMKFIHKEYKFNHGENKVTVDFTDNSNFFYDGQPIQMDIEKVSHKCFYISEVWWASHSNTQSLSPNEDVTLTLESIEIQYLENISVAASDSYCISLSSFDEVFPSGTPNTLNNYSCFYFISDKQGNIMEINSGNSQNVFTKEQAENLTKNENALCKIDNKEYKRTVSSDDEYIVYSFISNAMAEESTSKLILISALSGGGMFVLVLILVYFISVRAVRPISQSYTKQKEFISNASHELKTPITVISATTELMEKKNGKDRLTDCIFAQTQKMAGLVNEMLSLTRLSDTEKSYSDFKCFNISKTVENAVLYFESIAFEEHRKIITDIQPDIQYTGSERRIDELIGILTDNAVKYSDENSEIKITLKLVRDKVVITCENPCYEFDINDIPHIFERFYRGDKSHSDEKQGYGLGLSIAKEIVALHKGSINAEYKNNTILFNIIL